MTIAVVTKGYSVPTYLFVRLLEACNAGCTMCRYAHSNDQFRLGVSDFKTIISRSRQEGIRFIRFTGGEPLVHAEICSFVSIITQYNLRSSIISNGLLLKKKLPALAHSGLNQIIVSIDGIADTHDRLRGTKGLFKKCIEGLILARQLGVQLRVNSVVGPDNFREMPKLQELLTQLGVEQWEMSSLKLSGPLSYRPEDRRIIEEEIVPAIFGSCNTRKKLVPFGKIWCGNTVEERNRYFLTGITPHADSNCDVVDYVRYLDAKNMRLYVCPMIPHRKECVNLFPAFINNSELFSNCSADIERQADYFRVLGCSECTGCSTTAAAFKGHQDVENLCNEWQL